MKTEAADFQDPPIVYVAVLTGQVAVRLKRRSMEICHALQTRPRASTAHVIDIQLMCTRQHCNLLELGVTAIMYDILSTGVEKKTKKQIEHVKCNKTAITKLKRRTV